MKDKIKAVWKNPKLKKEKYPMIKRDLFFILFNLYISHHLNPSNPQCLSFLQNSKRGCFFYVFLNLVETDLSFSNTFPFLSIKTKKSFRACNYLDS